MPLPIPGLLALILSVGLQILAYSLLPKPKGPKPLSIEDYETPTAEGGRPIPVLFGSVMITGPNIVSTHDKDIRRRTVPISGSK